MSGESQTPKPPELSTENAREEAPGVEPKETGGPGSHARTPVSVPSWRGASSWAR